MSPKSKAGFRWTRLPSGPPAIGASQGVRLPLAVMLCAGLALAAVDAQAAELTTRLAMRLEQPALKDARVGVMVVRERDGEVLFEHDAERLLIPASNMKIMTSMGALSEFGPSFQFETRILSDREPDAKGAVSALMIVGGGDPVLNSEDWWRLAADLLRLGLRRIDGDIFVDDSLFDAEYWHPRWKGVSGRAYHAPVSALTANYGAYFIAVQPGRAPGDPVSVAVDPPIPYLHVSNRAVTGARKAQQTLSVARSQAGDGVENVNVRGVVRAGDDRDVFPRSVRDPALYAGAVLKLQLEALGIEVHGSVRRGGAELPHVLAIHKGRPLSEIVRLLMKYSNNSIAESLVKSLAVSAGAKPGTWAAGLGSLRSGLHRLGLSGEGAVFVDGSGLSPANRLSAKILVSALRVAGRSFRWGPEFLTALPIASRDGTLERRVDRAADRIRAKTGLLSDQRVTALSGLAELASGDIAIFSILVNGYAGGSRAAMDAVDRFAVELTR